MLDKEIKEMVDAAIDLVLVYTDLQRTYHACQIHDDKDACTYIEEKIEDVRKKQKAVEYYGRELGIFDTTERHFHYYKSQVK